MVVGLLTPTTDPCYPIPMDLFSITYDDPESDHQIALRDAMQDQWRKDQSTIRSQGRVPDWIGEPSPLSRDKARLLTLLYDQGCIYWTGHPSRNNQDVTERIGLQKTANAKATIDACLRAGLIESRLYRGEQVFQLTHEGEFALDEYQIDVELGIL